jgi:hypothetical protein
MAVPDERITILKRRITMKNNKVKVGDVYVSSNTHIFFEVVWVNDKKVAMCPIASKRAGMFYDDKGDIRACFMPVPHKYFELEIDGKWADEPIIRSFGAAPDGFGYEYEDVVIDEDHGVARKWNGQPVAI